MNMLSFRPFTCGLTTIGALMTALFAFIPQSRALSEQDQIEVARSVISVDRKAEVAAVMQLTDKEADAFWPLYRQYRNDMDKIDDDLMKLVTNYFESYPSGTGDVAEYWIKDYIDIQVKRVQKRAEYLRKFAQILPPLKGLRFVQVDTRLDLAIHLRLAASVPLAPLPPSAPSTSP